ncbi:hypothetical protein [Sphingobium lactosutens]|uniref:Uncharacterized protein n=1 Tax=Sphingobium lactosutens DS20 TaxID=1331060 RepID=T0HGP6_9SPHN|nr:hypothetical protein [Sphingobium lactosutens]EQB12187.1 hypothetical protein RLDS_20765 [Sphingobium lactosutens DS20]
MSSLAAHIARETVVSAVISGAISAAFFFGLFGLDGVVPVRGWTGFAADFVPQSAPVALMACLVPALMARRAIRSGRLGASLRHTGMGLVRLALACAVLAALLGGAVAWLWTMSGLVSLNPVTALLIKVGYGALLGALVTRRMLHHMLRPFPIAKD